MNDQILEKLSGGRITFTVVADDMVVGTTSVIPGDTEEGIEIGATQFTPSVWGTGVNRRTKRLLIDALFARGYSWVQLRTDERNARSAAAIRGLGAQSLGVRQDALVRRDGSIRSSAFFRVYPPHTASDAVAQ